MIFSIFLPFPFIFSIKIQTKWEVACGGEDDLQNSWKKNQDGIFYSRNLQPEPQHHLKKKRYYETP